MIMQKKKIRVQYSTVITVLEKGILCRYNNSTKFQSMTFIYCVWKVKPSNLRSYNVTDRRIPSDIKTFLFIALFDEERNYSTLHSVILVGEL